VRFIIPLPGAWQEGPEAPAILRLRTGPLFFRRQGCSASARMINRGRRLYIVFLNIRFNLLFRSGKFLNLIHKQKNRTQ
jgi:hypothetical protein